MGKSTTLAREAQRLRDLGGTCHLLSQRIDLRSFSSEALLFHRVFESDAFVAWSHGTSHLVLHLDSLDEALLRIDTIANLLASELPQFPIDRLSIRIACRTAVWPADTLEPALKSIWGEAAFGAFELAPLRRIDVVDATQLQGIDPQAFIPALFEADAVNFAIRPLTLNMLLDIFKRDGRLPKRVSELYRRGCLTLCEEVNPSRRDSKRLGTLGTAQRLRTAERIAAVTMLSNRYAIWTGAEIAGMPAEDVSLAELATGQEQGAFTAFEVGEDHLREVLDTGLFSSRGGSRMGWAHQSHAEYLAALYLIEKKVSAANILKILLHPSGGLVPQLLVVAAWVASLSKEVRDLLIESEPLVLLRGDLTGWSEEDVAALARSFLTALEQNRANDLMMHISNFYPRLAHSGLAALLRPYIVGANKNVLSRRAAIMIAESCELKVLQPELLRLACDKKADSTLRARAIAALRDCGDHTVPAKMMPFARGRSGPDTQDDLKGYALQILWPRHLKASQLFAMITPPNEGYTGAYVLFLNHLLPDSLTVADLPHALRWANTFIATAGYNGQFHLKSLADSLLTRAWQHLNDEAVLMAVVNYVSTCLVHGGELFRGTTFKERDTFLEALKTEAEPRRRFLAALMRRPVERIEAFNFKRTSLLQADDLAWLLACAPGGVAYDKHLRAESVCNLVESAANPYERADFEALYSAASQWPLLWERYKGMFEGVELNSVDAQQAKQIHLMTQKANTAPPPPLITPPPTQRVAEQLAAFDAGHWRAFWRLNIQLTLAPTSRFYGSDLHYRISDLPGWTEADPPTRDRIVKAAERYVAIGKTSVAKWIGRGSHYHADLAAFRALILLKEQDPVAYSRVSLASWHKWAPAIASIVQDIEDKAPAAQLEVLADAVTKAPDAFTMAVRTQIRRERSKVLKKTTTVAPLTSFLLLRGLKGVWNNQTLCAGVFEELRDPRNTADQFIVLLDLLLRAKYVPARADALAGLTGHAFDADRAAATAAALVSESLLEAWPVVWPLIVEDDSFGRAFFVELSQRFAFRDKAFIELGEVATAELYVHLMQLFPRVDDPHHTAGVAHFVGPAEAIAHLRDALPSQIAQRGTMGAVSALRWIVRQLPQIDWLPFSLQRAEQIMRMRTWAPLAPADISKLVALQDHCLVQTPDDLCALLVTCLRNYERSLHGEQTPVRALWDRQTSGKTFRPVEEDALSDHVKLYLQRELTDRGIVANHEVEIGRVPGASIGSRTDIRIDAVRRTADDKPLDTITAVIETKGCWNAGLRTALQEQLADDYMARLNAPVGIYLVGWFDKASWDITDARRAAVPSAPRADVQKELDALAASVTAAQVRAVVLDCHLSQPKNKGSILKTTEPKAR